MAASGKVFVDGRKRGRPGIDLQYDSVIYFDRLHFRGPMSRPQVRSGVLLEAPYLRLPWGHDPVTDHAPLSLDVDLARPSVQVVLQSGILYLYQLPTLVGDVQSVWEAVAFHAAGDVDTIAEQTVAGCLLADDGGHALSGVYARTDLEFAFAGVVDVYGDGASHMHGIHGKPDQSGCVVGTVVS